MLIIKVKYWLFNYKLPQLSLAAGWQARAGWEGPVIQDKSHELLRPVLLAIAGLELKKLSRALIHRVPTRYQAGFTSDGENRGHF